MSTSFLLYSLPSLIVLLMSGPSAPGRHWFDMARLRPLSQVLDQTLVNAYRHSPTIRRLVAELDTSNVIVHLVARSNSGGPAGSLTLATCAGGTRFLRVTIDLTLSPNARTAILGHELQHAVEVARARSVVDQDSLAALFRHIGYPSGGLSRRVSFETDAARRVEAQVLSELRRGPT